MSKKIAAGLAAYDGPAATGPNLNSIIGISDKPADVLALATRTATEYQAWADNFAMRENNEYRIIDSRHADQTGDDDFTRQIRARDREKQKAEWRRGALADLEPKIIPSVQTALALIDRVRDSRQIMTGPMALADQCGLDGDEEFHRKASRVANADVNALRNSIVFAVGKKDTKLVAACVRRLEAMSKQERDHVGFTPASLAEAAFGDDYRALTATLNEIEAKARSVVAKWRHANGFGQVRRGRSGISDKAARDSIEAGLAAYRAKAKTMTNAGT